jgi:hypothetical protein
VSHWLHSARPVIVPYCPGLCSGSFSWADLNPPSYIERQPYLQHNAQREGGNPWDSGVCWMRGGHGSPGVAWEHVQEPACPSLLFLLLYVPTAPRPRYTGTTPERCSRSVACFFFFFARDQPRERNAKGGLISSLIMGDVVLRLAITWAHTETPTTLSRKCHRRC